MQDKMKDMQERAQHQADYSKHMVQERFRRINDMMTDAARDIDRYMKREDGDFVDMASWSLNTLENLIRNINAATILKDIARYQAGLEVAQVIDSLLVEQEEQEH